LRTAHWEASRPYPQYGLALIGLVDIQPCDFADNPIDCDFYLLLKRLEGRFCRFAKQSIDGSGTVKNDLGLPGPAGASAAT
jgi:hypothetical protein